VVARVVDDLDPLEDVDDLADRNRWTIDAIGGFRLTL
jgi:hypothetical protein